MMPEQSLVTVALNSWKSAVERADRLFPVLSEEQLMKEVAPGKEPPDLSLGTPDGRSRSHATAAGFLASASIRKFDVLFLSNPDKTIPELPPVKEIKSAWDEVNGRLLTGFASLSASEWLQKHTAVSEEEFAEDPLRNRFAVLLSRTNHLAYHLGQTALVPK